MVCFFVCIYEHISTASCFKFFIASVIYQLHFTTLQNNAYKPVKSAPQVPTFFIEEDEVSIPIRKDIWERKYWNNKCLYLFNCVGYINGIGNFLRFPNMFIKYTCEYLYEILFNCYYH